MERLYEKERDKIHSKLLKFEKQSGFKTEVEQWESRVKQLKHSHNDLVYKIEKLTKKDTSLDFVILTQQMTQNIEKELGTLRDVENVEENTENNLAHALIAQESLAHMMENYKADIFKLKKTTEMLKRIRKKFDMTSHDLDYELERYKLMNARIVGQIQKYSDSQVKKGQMRDDVSIDSLFAQNLEDEMSLFEDRIIMDQIKGHEAKLEKLKGEDMIRRKKLYEQKKQAAKELEMSRTRKENLFVEKELDKRKVEILKHMAKMKVNFYH
jgi:hypothetical protein